MFLFGFFPQLSLRVWWVQESTLSKGGEGGGGRVDPEWNELNEPLPHAFSAWMRYLWKKHTKINKGCITVSGHKPVLCAWFQVRNCVLSLRGGHRNHMTGHVTTRQLNVVCRNGLPIAVRSGPCHQQRGGSTAYLEREYVYNIWFVEHKIFSFITQPLTVVRWEGGDGVEGAVVKLTADDHSLAPLALWACRKKIFCTFKFLMLSV